MLSLENLTIFGVRTELSDLFVSLRQGLAEEVAAAWDAARQRPSPVDAIVGGMEGAQAAFLVADEAGRAAIAPALGRAAHLVIVHSWHGKTEEASAIYRACAAVLGGVA